MAEAWLEEEEEELRDSAGNRRHRRSNLNQATERPERNKPEHRFPGQGPLSSIRAVIKRTSRTTAQSEQQRDRRRPEITIVAAEPIGPGSWFHGGPPGGLGFPPPPPPQWRPSDSHPPEPPSYEQVIKEINQVQVTTTSANVEPRRTSTCATQTDFPLEDDRPGSGNNVIHQPVLCDQATATVQRIERPERPRQPLPFVKNNVQDSGHQIAIVNTAGTSTRHEDTNVPNITRYPVPRPRTKPNLKPVENHILSIFQGNGEVFFQTTAEGELPFSHSCPGFDDNFLEELFEMNNMSHDRSQNSITARIKAFESQVECNEHPRRPEIAPRSINTRGGIPGKPSVAPKPFPNRTPGEWDPGKDNKPKCTPREGLVTTILSDSGGVAKPELPKKPKPSIVRSSSGDIPDVLLGTSLSGINSKESDRIMPVPAPRPMLPKKTLQTDNSVPTGAKPLIPAPKFSIATQAKAFNSVETPATRAPAQVTQSKSVGELDLINFDDDVLPPVLPSPEVINDSNANSDPFQLISKEETEKEQPGPPVILRKPTVIRISGKLGKSCEELQVPPPLPTEKPVGLYNKSAARARPTVRKEWQTFDSTEETWTRPVLPTRPAGVKVFETAQQPPLKGPPGRPPPPRLSRNASNRDAFPRSSSDAGLGAKQNTSGINKSKSQVLKRQQPDLPPRPKPGHPLYNKYTLPLPHGLAEKDIVSCNPRELSCKRGEVLLLLEQTDNNYVHCQKGGITGDVKVTNMKIINPLDDSLENRQKDVLPRMEDSHTPHALVLHDYVGEHEDDLSLSSGEIVYLLEKVDQEWYRGKCKGNSGIFPANHVRVMVDVPEKLNPKRHSSISIIKGPRCVARFEFIGDQKDELSFSEGDTIVLKEYISDEWAKGELRGHTGIFPINFVEIVEDLPAKTSDVRDSRKIKLPGLSSQQSQLSGDWCEALFDFAAEADDDLPFKKGDKILILERLDLEWYKGTLNGREGILPAAFVQICSGLTARQTQGGKPGKARALYDFSGENDDELSFKTGDIISSLESVDNDWMSGELHGTTGIFPKNFVQRC